MVETSAPPTASDFAGLKEQIEKLAGTVSQLAAAKGSERENESPIFDLASEHEEAEEKKNEEVEDEEDENFDATIRYIDGLADLPSKGPLREEAMFVRRISAMLQASRMDKKDRKRIDLELQARRRILKMKDENYSNVEGDFFPGPPSYQRGQGGGKNKKNKRD
ncbi:hypothetical protein J8273_6780 [Carpediemonas membranifera]|uniref:Uncharacterized protein n=1 Tax=Carpediemonas membranifera TaxID=201153 RepID=A0A8J6B808_9EUKA|nr:hypothetical protein J8273_6780 [Carpediemonas membranifera]|eukprot:KAG9391932.1 hypothetical protein J8273_6780 [Carpediemonas membranifera]